MIEQEGLKWVLLVGGATNLKGRVVGITLKGLNGSLSFNYFESPSFFQGEQ